MLKSKFNPRGNPDLSLISVVEIKVHLSWKKRVILIGNDLSNGFVKSRGNAAKYEPDFNPVDIFNVYFFSCELF